MKQLISQLIFCLKFRWAVRKADRLQHITHRKHMVLVINHKLQVLSKKEVKTLLAKHIFRRGTTIQQIEQKALYTTL